MQEHEEQKRKPLEMQEWQQFEQQARQIFQRLPKAQRLKMWAWLGEPLWEEATEKQSINALALLMQFAARGKP